DVGSELLHDEHRFLAVCRLTEQLEVIKGSQKDSHTASHQVVIVENTNPNGCGRTSQIWSFRVETGHVTVIVVPRPLPVSISSVAPIKAARSCMMPSPRWLGFRADGSKPRPSSVMRSSVPSGVGRSVIEAWRARACFMMLFSASCVMR